MSECLACLLFLHLNTSAIRALFKPPFWWATYILKCTFFATHPMLADDGDATYIHTCLVIFITWHFTLLSEFNQLLINISHISRSIRDCMYIGILVYAKSYTYFYTFCIRLCSNLLIRCKIIRHNFEKIEKDWVFWPQPFI